MDCCRMQEILCVIDTEADEFLSKSNVVGVALSTKIVNGVDIKEPSIQILVEKKLKECEIESSSLIPKEYKGIQTDVVETGRFKCAGYVDMERPMLFGASIGPAATTFFGSAGCLVYDANNYYILSNNHVLALENFLPIDTPILQPAEIDGGIYPDDVIANLSKFIPINFITPISTPDNYVDAAIAKIVDKTGIVSRDIHVIGSVKGTTAPTLGLLVKKAGVISEYTRGAINSIGATIIIDYSEQRAKFKNQILTTIMAEQGDSGSLVLDDKNNAVGLLMGNSGSHSVLNPINTVLDALQVKIALN